MDKVEYRHYKDEYLEDLKHDLDKFLKHWKEINNLPIDKQMNNLVEELFLNCYRRIKTLSFFPEYELPKE